MEKVIAKDQRAMKKKTKAKSKNSEAGTQSPRSDSNTNGEGESPHSPAQNKQPSNFNPKKEAIIRILDMNDSPPKEPVKENTDSDAPDYIALAKDKDREYYTENSLMATYPNFTLLATLFAPNYFGEIALNTQQER